MARSPGPILAAQPEYAEYSVRRFSSMRLTPFHTRSGQMAEGKGIEPPAAVCAAAYGFEDREAHQSLSASITTRGVL